MNKKKILILALMAALLILAVTVVFIENRPAKAEAEAAADTSAVDTQVTTAVEKIRFDRDALVGSHSPEEIVATIDGYDITWEEYSAWLLYFISDTENTMDSYASYGQNINWTDAADDQGKTFVDYLQTYTESYMNQVYTLKKYARDNGVTLSDDSIAAIADQTQQDIVTACGEGADEAQFNEYLNSIGMRRLIYDELVEFEFMYRQTFTDVFGENGAFISDEDAEAYLQENEYLNANHILMLTKDMSTGEQLDETAKAEKLEKLNELLAELKTIEDKDELKQRFEELKAEYCEDSGKISNPEGYIFTSGEMVQEFEDAAKSLEFYGLSDIVETTYGYHILLRLPLTPDSIIQTSSEGTQLSVRAVLANERYGKELQTVSDALVIEYADGFELNAADYLKTT